MMQALITIFYMISAVLFIRGIKLLGKAVAFQSAVH